LGSEKENKVVNKGVYGNKLPATVKKEKVPEDPSEEWVAGKEPVELPAEVPAVEETKECVHCCEEPCVWIIKKRRHDLL
jgi:hypothetical protein